MKELSLIVLATLVLLPTGLLAQTGFHVSKDTGLEPVGAPPPAAPVESKPKTVPVEKKATEITCTGETTFDTKAGMAVFIKEVKIKDPQFVLSADKLTAYLKKPPGGLLPEGNATPTPSPTPSAHPGEASPASGLERAVAEGSVLITQERTDEKTGEITRYTGKGERAEYNAATGELTLSGWPQIQQGFNNQVATEEGTVMIMDKEGHLRTKGPSMTVIKADTKPAKTP